MKITPNRRHVVAALAYDGLCTFEFGIAVEVFGQQRPEMGDDWYEFRTAATGTEPLRAMGGLTFRADDGLDALAKADTIIIPGWAGVDVPIPEALIEALKQAHRRGARIATICSGVFPLAATGLLDGRRATTHWRYAAALVERYPRIIVDPDVLYVDEGALLTSAGSAAGIDLLLHIVRQDYGATKANMVARRLVMPPHRQGGQTQFIERPISKLEGNRLAPLLDKVRSDLSRDYRVADLARDAAMSERTFLRRFSEATGMAPGEWLIAERLEVAKEHLERGEVPIEEVATIAGFGTTDTLRHHFRQRLGVSPRGYRSRFLRASA
jgi:AraC family transcriptional activator FtrA